MPEPTHVFVAGASRGVGYEVATLLRQAGIAVTAMLRSPDRQPALEDLGVRVVPGDALHRAEVDRALSSNTPIDAMISTIGGVSSSGERADFLGNRNLVDAYMAVTTTGDTTGRPTGRFIMVSSIGSGSSAAALPDEIRRRLAVALDEKGRAEEHLIASGLTYTVIRPGGLRSEPATGRGVLTANPGISGSIHRADVASLVVRCLTSRRADNTVLSAVDRELVRDGRPVEPFDLG